MVFQKTACRVMAAMCLALFVSQSSYAKVKHYGQLFHPSGTPRAGARLYVFSESGPATLYADAKGAHRLENPVTTGKDGVYWFYADNGVYSVGEKTADALDAKFIVRRQGVHSYHEDQGNLLIVQDGKKQTVYRALEEGISLWDPREHRELTATSESPALTLKQIDSGKDDVGAAIVFEREHEPGSPRKGPWRWIVNEVAPDKPPASFILVYNTDLVRDGDAKGGFRWAPRDVDDVCIRLQMTPAKGTGGMGFGGYLEYAVAPKARAATRPVFANAMRVQGPAVLPGGSRLTVGGGMENTRYVRTYTAAYLREDKDKRVPFPLTGAGFVGGAPAETSPGDVGQVWVPDTRPEKFGHFRQAAEHAEKNPAVVSGGGGGMFHFASVGKALVKLAPGVKVEPGDTLVTSKHAGCAEVDNDQTDAIRIVGWALEKSDATLAGFVLIVVK